MKKASILLKNGMSVNRYNINSIRFSKNIVNELIKNYSSYDSVEKGGILIGQVNETEVLVTDFNKPRKFDSASKHQFIRKVKGINDFLTRIFFFSNRTKTYLGEWHTHLEDNPTPSKKDKESIVIQYKKNICNVPFVISLIIGYKKITLLFYNGENIEEKIFKINKLR